MTAAPLKVVASGVALRGMGSTAVGRGILDGLDQRSDVEVSAWVAADWANGTRRPVQAGWAQKLWAENVTLRREADKRSVLFSMGDTGTISPSTPHLLFVQQAHIAYRQRDWGYEPSPRFGAKMRLLAGYFRLAQGGVTRFVVQTQDMRAHLAERWQVDPKRIDVVPSSVLPLPDYKATAADHPYAVCVTSNGEHKNTTILADVLAASRTDLNLALTLTPTSAPALAARARELGVAHRILWLGTVPRARALSLLAGAVAAIQPSHLESFGFGLYEAMAVGCPIVVADLGFAHEACGEAGFYAASGSPGEFAARLDEVFAGSQPLLTSRSRARFQSVALSWAEVAARFADSLRRTSEAYR